MGRREDGQGQFFYSFDLDKVIPPDRLVRQIDGLLDLGWVHRELRVCYHRQVFSCAYRSHRTRRLSKLRARQVRPVRQRPLVASSFRLSLRRG
jgi:hypothetical protein